MPTITDLRAELDDMTTMKFISSAFTEASAARIKKIRDAFERNRQFYDEISHVYLLVKANAVRWEAGKKHGKQVLPKAEDIKTLFVALTSNQRFYGNLNINIMRKFTEDAEKNKTDLIVLGNTGNEFMRSARLGKEYKSVIFSRERPSQEEIRSFLDSIKDYTKVVVYYPKFLTLLSQTVGVLDITQTAAPEEQKSLEEEIHIIFEPELSKMIAFFELQVRSLLFLRIMLEADLARTAARLISMSMAEERADELIKDTKSQMRKVMTSFINARLLETFAGMSQWKKQ